MTIYFSSLEKGFKVWITRRGITIDESDGETIEMALGNLIYALSQGDDPDRIPRIVLKEK